MKSDLSDAEKQSLVDDGFVILRNVIPLELVDAAKKLVDDVMPTNTRRILAPAALATHPQVIGVFKNSPISQILRKVMGPFPDVVSCQVAVTPPFDKLVRTVGAHVDGGWSGPIPDNPAEIEPIRGRPIDAVKYFGENDEVRGSNDGLLWQDPEQRISTGS